MGLIPNLSTEKLKIWVYNVEDVITRMGDRGVCAVSVRPLNNSDFNISETNILKNVFIFNLL